VCPECGTRHRHRRQNRRKCCCSKPALTLTGASRQTRAGELAYCRDPRGTWGRGARGRIGAGPEGITASASSSHLTQQLLWEEYRQSPIPSVGRAESLARYTAIYRFPCFCQVIFASECRRTSPK
jgi:hypothetical protein